MDEWLRKIVKKEGPQLSDRAVASRPGTSRPSYIRIYLMHHTAYAVPCEHMLPRSDGMRRFLLVETKPDGSFGVPPGLPPQKVSSIVLLSSYLDCVWSIPQL